MLYQNKAVSVLDFMVMPGLIYVLINNYIPMVGISFAFKKIDYSIGVWRSGWVGLSNFKFLFQSSDSYTITKNTLLYNLVFIILGNILGMIVGICLSEIFSKKLQKLYQTTILLPQLISWVIVAYIAYGFLSNEAGWINKTVLGAGNEINFYGTTKYWPFILVFFHLWKGLGYNSIIYLSAIVGIDRNLYEAASIDGCSKWGSIRHITLPLLKSTVITLVTLSVGRIFYSDFGLFYQVPMNSGSLYSVTDTIDTYVYRALMQLNNISMASAASAYQAIIGFVLVLIFNLIVNKVSKENALF
ncbi:MAG: sugar ABC transporter permease [Lachnospiraceae bacterium]|nr:sugar ABC transporter permease [Lachnospiraceae bacterium]